MASKSVIHPGEESESSAEEAFSDDEVLTSADQEEIDTSLPLAQSEPPAQRYRLPRTPSVQHSVLHHKLKEANDNLCSSIKLQIVGPYQRATKNVQNLTFALSRIQASMSEACLHLQQIRDDLKATEEKTFDIVSCDYLVDVKI